MPPTKMPSASASPAASVNKGKGSEAGNGVTHTETTLNAGNNLTIRSGRDTTLTGAQATGEQVTMDVGRNLTLTSEQDSDNYDSKQQNASAGGSFTFGSMTGSGSVNLSRDKMHSTYDSVQEQTGLFAGAGGFDITVGEHTQLNGAVIGSTAAADKNRLNTGTLGFSNIENRAEYEVEHQSVGISSGGNIGGQFAGNMANSLLVGVNGSGSDSSTTKSAVSEGTITIRDKDNQKQDVGELSRDVEHANQTLSPIFDKEKEQNRLKEAQLIGEIGTQAMDIARTQGKIEATKAGKAELEKHGVQQPGKDATKEERAAYDKALTETAGYKTAQQKWGTGSAIQQGLQAATAAVQGLAGGDMAKALAGASAPYLAEVIHNMTTDPVTGKVNSEANLMAHAVLGAVISQVNGNGALAGASGAVMGEYIAQQMYPGVDRDKLSEDQRQTISALSTLAAGLAGGLAGDSSADAVAGAQAGKNAVENNALSSTQALAFDKELSDCRKSGGDCQAVIDKWKQVSDKQSAETDDKLKDNPLEAVVIDKEVAQGGIDMAQRPAWLDNIGADVMTDEQAKAYVQYWNAQDLAKIDASSPDWMKFAVFISDPENQVAVASLGLLGKNLVQLAKNTLVTKSLFKEMTAQGIKYTPENVVSAAKDVNGKIIFLEKGNSKAGLQHIVDEHAKDFANIGVAEAQIPSVVIKAVSKGKVVGYQGKGTGRPIYETVINGETHRLAITVSSNGFVVGANPAGRIQ